MRARRLFTILAVVLSLAVVAAACGDSGGGDDQAAPTTAAQTGGDTGGDGGGGSDGGGTASGDTFLVGKFADACNAVKDKVTVPEGFNIGLVTDIGKINDGTFNEGVYKGFAAAAECFGVQNRFIETASEADYTTNLKSILDDDPEVVVTVGFMLASDTLAEAQAHPEVTYVGVDQFQEEYPDNYVGVLAADDQGGCMMGGFAGTLTESNVIGVVAGVEAVPPVVRFANAFKHCAETANPDVDVRIVYHESFTDVTGGAATAEQMLGEGADVIFGAGGPTGSSGIKTAAAKGAWVIGVDTDEYYTTFEGGAIEGADRLATSAIKDVGLGVFNQIAMVLSGDFQSGIFTLTAANGGMDYAPAHDADLPADAVKALEEFRAGLADGSISTGVDPITGQPLDG